MINYNNKSFKLLSSSKNGEVATNMVFEYKQEGNIVICHYSGGHVISGHLIGIVENNGHINMRYHQVNKQHTLMTGICYSKPEISSSGKIRLHEQWQWTSGDLSKGESVLEEI